MNNYFFLIRKYYFFTHSTFNMFLFEYIVNYMQVVLFLFFREHFSYEPGEQLQRAKKKRNEKEKEKKRNIFLKKQIKMLARCKNL